MATLRKMTRVGADVRQIARLLQAKAPENHMLAYITPEEAELLKSRGGSGMPDPQTGIPTYYVPDPEYVDPYALIHMKYPQQDSGFDASANTVPVSESNIVSYAGDTSRPTDSGTTASSYHTGSSPSAYGQPSAFSSFKQETAPSYHMANYAPSAYARAEYPASLGLPPVDASRDRPAPPIDTTPSRTIGERYSDLAKSLGVKEDTLSRIGLAGLQVGLGARQARLAREEARKAKEEQQKLAAPYQAKGAELQRQAQAGELTPAGRQQLQTVQAQAAQAASSRGGVGAQQTAARVEAIRNQLLQQQYDYGLKLSGIGDQILLGSIRTGLEADRYVNQLSNTYFTNVARTLAGSPTVIQYGVPR
jgi:hypothetical protein